MGNLRITWLLFAVSIAFVFVSCRNEDEEPIENIDKTISVASIGLNKTILTLMIGKEETLKATVEPANATEKDITWTSSDKTKAMIDESGKITAIAAGEATVTAKLGDKTASCLVTITIDSLTDDEGVVINGVRWATRNVDAPGTFAAAPEEAGMFYQWNRKAGWSATNPLVNSDGSTTWDKSTAEGEVWLKANDPSPAGWRIPTIDEIQSLLNTDKVSNVWTTENNVSGRKFTDKTSGNSIFIPAVGRRCRTYSTILDKSNGFYWSSSINIIQTYNIIYSYGFELSSNTATQKNNYYRANGFSIRCVAE